ncbi:MULTISPECIES: sugar phosphate nucleotidyltransferase [Halolamina]|uniref:Bifunctional protein GlmU n=1 Tax=Halolamina pelagica TaxID=699431 RepID=A0A1I5UYF1_9EURY|nr:MULTISPECIES: sugar phosphate nucleotidyltransferase [Halolamina]NHX36822.1 NTP transferase domain-containing protein [Halolamina sp. R1-12]SFQ00212.1 glucose-1-phosphate thymidylyltransferase [Halolamina pelagica]
MDAVVLAAGEGERLAPLTESRPKPMLPAANRPILSYVFDAVVAADVDSIVVVIGYERDHIRDQFGNSYRDTPIEYVTQEKQLGSGHALRQAKGAVDGPFLVLNGDQIVAPEMVVDVRDAYEPARAFGALGAIEHADAAQYGTVSIADGTVSALFEDPATDEHYPLNAGVYAFDERLFEALDATPRTDGELSLPTTLERVVGDGDTESIQAVRTEGLWVDATYAWDLLTVAERLLDAGWIEGVAQEDDVWVADSARVHDSAVLRPPVAISADAVVGPNAVVGPATSLGRNATVGANATVSRSVLDVDTRVGANASLHEVVAGRAVDIGAGTVAPSGAADIPVAGHVVEGQSVGAVLADRVTVEGAGSFDPGAIVGTGATLGVGTHITGRVDRDTEVVR